jgi:hypothetical protein
MQSQQPQVISPKEAREQVRQRLDTLCGVTPEAESNEAGLDGDLLEGAAGVALYLFGSARLRRKVYWLVENQALPIFRIGTQLCARKSTLLRWIEDQERAGEHGNSK